MTRLSLQTRLKLIEYHKKKNGTLMQTAQKFATTITTVHNTLKKKCFWVKLYNSEKNGRAKKFSFSENSVIEDELSKWYWKIKDSKRFEGVTQLELRKKIKSVAKEHNIDFKVTRMWVKKFVDTHDIIFKKVDLKKSGTKLESRAKTILDLEVQVKSKSVSVKNTRKSVDIVKKSCATLTNNSVKHVKVSKNNLRKNPVALKNKANISKTINPKKKGNIRLQISSSLFSKRSSFKNGSIIGKERINYKDNKISKDFLNNVGIEKKLTGNQVAIADCQKSTRVIHGKKSLNNNSDHILAVENAQKKQQSLKSKSKHKQLLKSADKNVFSLNKNKRRSIRNGIKNENNPKELAKTTVFQTNNDVNLENISLNDGNNKNKTHKKGGSTSQQLKSVNKYLLKLDRTTRMSTRNSIPNERNTEKILDFKYSKPTTGELFPINPKNNIVNVANILVNEVLHHNSVTNVSATETNKKNKLDALISKKLGSDSKFVFFLNKNGRRSTRNSIKSSIKSESNTEEMTGSQIITEDCKNLVNVANNSIKNIEAIETITLSKRNKKNHFDSDKNKQKSTVNESSNEEKPQFYSESKETIKHFQENANYSVKNNNNYSTCYAHETNINNTNQSRSKRKDVFDFDVDKEDTSLDINRVPLKRHRKAVNPLVKHPQSFTTNNNNSVANRLTRGRVKSLSFSVFENINRRMTRGTVKTHAVHEMSLPPRRRKKKIQKTPPIKSDCPIKFKEFSPENNDGVLEMASLPYAAQQQDINPDLIQPKKDYMETSVSSKKNGSWHHRTPRRSLSINPNLNSTTDDDDDEQRIAKIPSKNRRSKKMVKNSSNSVQKESLSKLTNKEQLPDSGPFENETYYSLHKAKPEHKVDYYEAIEDDKVVEIFCSERRPSSSPKEPASKKNKKSKIEIHSNIEIFSGSQNTIKTKRIKSVSSRKQSASLDESSEQTCKMPNNKNLSGPCTPTNQTAEMSWSHLFPELDETVSADELVNQINEIEFQYDPDPFKNLKIEVLSSGYTDEDENDGAEGDDELEEDDVSSSESQPLLPNYSAPAQREGARMPGAPRPSINNRTIGVRTRTPIARSRSAAALQPVRDPIRPQNRLRSSALLQAKRKKMDLLTFTDKDDDDCKLICIQPKNTELPQIKSIQDALDSEENRIMKLSDDITLPVYHPPQKSDAKAVVNVLASRGITVRTSSKPKDLPTKQQPAVLTSLSRDNAVIVVDKNASFSKPAASDSLPTVDLTEDVPSGRNANSLSRNRSRLPYHCEMCASQYPNAMGLDQHRQNYHKITSGMCELGVPLINIKKPGIMQKLSQLGINNYIPLPSAELEGTFALPIISSKSPGNIGALGFTQMLSLGPVRTIPQTGASNKANRSDQS